MSKRQEFHTVRGYALQNQNHYSLTPSMEDYLEMIYRLSHDKTYLRIHVLATALNVQPPSATKMVQRLAKAGCLKYEKYGVLELTPRGRDLGVQLLKRHQTLENFLSLLGVKDNLLKDTEKIEHSLSQETLECIGFFVEFAKKNPLIMQQLNAFRKTSKPSGDL